VHNCVAGVSRSASIVIAYLMNRDKEKLDVIFERLLKKRSKVIPNESFRKQLRQFEKEILN